MFGWKRFAFSTCVGENKPSVLVSEVFEIPFLPVAALALSFSN